MMANNTGTDMDTWYSKNKFVHTPLANEVITIAELVLMPTIAIIGAILNAITIWIFSASFLKSSIHMYLLVLAIFDTLSLISFVLTYWIVLVLKPYAQAYDKISTASFIQENIMQFSTCEIRLFYTFFCRFLSVWTIVVISFERLLMIKFPIKSQRIVNRVKVSKIVICGLIFFSILFNIPWVFSFKSAEVPKISNPSEKVSICKPSEWFIYTRLFQFLLISFLPGVILVVANSVIACTLYENRRHWVKLSEKGDSNAYDGIHIEAWKREKRLLVRLFVLSTSFVVLTGPSMIMIGVFTFLDLQPNVNWHTKSWLASAYHISILLYQFNLSINFFVYSLTGKKFQNIVSALIHRDFKRACFIRRNLLSNEELPENYDETGGDCVPATNITNLQVSNEPVEYKQLISQNDAPETRF